MLQYEYLSQISVYPILYSLISSTNLFIYFLNLFKLEKGTSGLLSRNAMNLADSFCKSAIKWGNS